MKKHYKIGVIAIVLVAIFYSLFPAPRIRGVSNASYDVTPNVIGFYGNFTIRFNVDSAISAGGWIKIGFPNEFELPCNCGGVGWSKSDFLINGVHPAVDPDGNNGTNQKYVKLTLPTAMNLSRGAAIVIQISETARIKNPDTPGLYSLKISTSSESTEVATTLFEIGYSSIANLSFSLSSNTVASQTGVVIGFKTGLLGDLSQENYINVYFDEGFSLPATVSTNKIKVNGYRPLEARAMGRTMIISLPKGMRIPSSSQVVVEIEQAAGIVNPSVAGLYGIYLNTDKEPKKVRSNLVEIRDRPFVKTEMIITPENPDGKNGFYRTQPIVVLLPQTNTGEQVETYYQIDSQGEQLYSAPIYVPEGIHVLHFYSKSISTKEEPRSIELKVDLTYPAIKIISPENNSVLNQSKASLKIIVSDESPVELTINGKVAVPNEKGEYLREIDLTEGENEFTIIAEDLAGNSSEEKLKVFLYTISPTVKILSPANFQVFSDPSVVVKGTVKPANDTVIEVNGAEVSVGEDGIFEFALTLEKEGKNVINVSAKNRLSGKRVSISIVVYYQPVVLKKEIVVILTIGKKEAVVDGKTIFMDVAPYIDPTTNRTLVPLRFISEVFGGEVAWDAQNKTITISIRGKSIILQVGNLNALVDGTFVKLEQPPIIKEGRTMVPLRFVSESLGAQVGWDNTSKTITIVFPLT